MTYSVEEGLIIAHHKKLELYQRIADVSRDLQELTRKTPESDTDLGNLEALLARRSELMAQVDKVDQEIERLDVAGISLGTEEMLVSLQKKLLTIGQEIQQCSEDAAAAMEKDLTELRSKTKKARIGRKSRRAYYQMHDAGEGFFVDKRR